MNEVCFGDTVVTALNETGEVIGIDYSGRRAALRLTNGYIHTHDVTSLGITNYCDRYASAEARVVPTAPVDQIRVRVIVDFDFRLTR